MGAEQAYSVNLWRDICRLIRDRGPLSRAAISRALGRSPATVGRAVEHLIKADMLNEARLRDGQQAGRPAQPLEFNAGKKTTLVVDLRSTEAYAAMADMAGTILVSDHQWLETTSWDSSLTGVKHLVGHLLSLKGDHPHPSMLVIGAPSIVDDSGCIEWAPSLKWESLPLGELLEDEFHIQTLIENDVNLAALGEFWKAGGKQGLQDIVFVSIGTGIGAGIILDGKLHRGATDAAGEVSYFVTDVNVLRDNVGRMGSLENRVGGDGLVKMAQLVAQRYPTSRLTELMSGKAGSVQTRDILDLAENGDVAAGMVYKELVDILTIVISNIAVLLDPAMIILGGPNDWNWSSLIPAIQGRIGNSLLRPVNLVPSTLGGNAVILGGCFAGFEKFSFPGNS